MYWDCSSVLDKLLHVLEGVKLLMAALVPWVGDMCDRNRLDPVVSRHR